VLDALTNGSLASDIIGPNEIVSGAVTSVKLPVNAIPNVMNYTTTALSTTNCSVHRHVAVSFI
jgi:predicted transcriptional regulator